MTDHHSTTVEAAAACAREDADCDRPTLGEVLADEAPRCSLCGLRPTWADEGNPCDACRAAEAFWERALCGSKNECWEWTGTLSTEGYGTINALYAHRVAYTIGVGPIPDGFQIDHTCHDPDRCDGGPTCPHRRCVNPSHLEAVTQQENIRRGLRTKCSNGHLRTEANIYVRPDTGARQCRLCMRAADQRRTPRQRAKQRAREATLPCAWCVVQCQHEDEENAWGAIPCRLCREQPLAPDHPACLESYEAYRPELDTTEPF